MAPPSIRSIEPDHVEDFNTTISELEVDIELCLREIDQLDPEDDPVPFEKCLAQRLRRKKRLLHERDLAIEARKTVKVTSQSIRNSRRKHSFRPAPQSSRSHSSKHQDRTRVEKKVS